jgi:hypothetical protein
MQKGARNGAPILLQKFEFTRHVAAVSTLGHFKFNFLIVRQAFQTGTFNNGNMDKNVLSAFFWLNEPEAFGGVKPLYGTAWHTVLLYIHF